MYICTWRHCKIKITLTNSDKSNNNLDTNALNYFWKKPQAKRMPTARIKFHTVPRTSRRKMLCCYKLIIKKKLIAAIAQLNIQQKKLYIQKKKERVTQ
jgi:hypothetical protein